MRPHESEQQPHTAQPVLRTQRGTGGFTVAELMVVVAILGVLALIAGIAVFNYLRTLTITEYDNAAKSIYIAAQNTITDLQASGEWETDKDRLKAGNGATADRDDDDGATQNTSLSYVYVAPHASPDLSDTLLPPGTVEETVRSHAYVIEYCYETGAVYGVFYTEGTQDELNAYYSNGGSIRNRDTRLANNPIIGYYGGASAANLETGVLQDPVVFAGRSPVLTIEDPNLTTPVGGTPLKTSLLVTLGKPATTAAADVVAAAEQPATSTADAAAAAAERYSESVTVLLTTDVSGLGVQVSYIDAEGAVVTDTDQTYCSWLSDDRTAYSLNLLTMKGSTTVGPLLDGFNAGEEYAVEAKCVSSTVLARPTYGYGLGIWPSSDDVVFTSNIIADYETETDLYVYRSTESGQSENISFNLENWYNDATWANENLYYRFDNDSPINIESVTSNERNVTPQSGYYPYAFDTDKREQPHTVTFHVSNVDTLQPEDVVRLRVHVYRQQSGTETPAADVSKTLTINIHVMNSHRTEVTYALDRGSYYEVYVCAGESEIPAGYRLWVTSPAVLAEEGSSYVQQRDGSVVRLNAIPAGGSVSVRFFKLDTAASAPISISSSL